MNRLGTVVFTHENGEILQEGADFYVWPTGERRGYRTISFDSACEWLRIEKPLGWADYQRTQKLGRLIEKTKAGQIWKHTDGRVTTYYVWLSASEGCIAEHYLSRARAWMDA